jgi:hypothetical protein
MRRSKVRRPASGWYLMIIFVLALTFNHLLQMSHSLFNRHLHPLHWHVGSRKPHIPLLRIPRRIQHAVRSYRGSHGIVRTTHLSLCLGGIEVDGVARLDVSVGVCGVCGEGDWLFDCSGESCDVGVGFGAFAWSDDWVCFDGSVAFIDNLMTKGMGSSGQGLLSSVMGLGQFVGLCIGGALEGRVLYRYWQEL